MTPDEALAAAALNVLQLPETHPLLGQRLAAAVKQDGFSVAETAHIERLLAVEQAARAVCFDDLQDDFGDWQDIVLRWKGNRADWAALRAALRVEAIHSGRDAR